MNLKYLINKYNEFNINVQISEDYIFENAGVIKINKGISASFLLDEHKDITTLKIFFNCMIDVKKIDDYMEHIKSVLVIMQKSIEIMGNIPQIESNLIMTSLGLFDNTFIKGKKVKHLDYMYGIEVVDGLLVFTIAEEVKE